MSKRSRTGSTESAPVPAQPAPSRLVQARVPAELYKRIERCANAEMISVAAYVRRTLKNYVPGG